MDKKLEWQDVFNPDKHCYNEQAECQQALDALLFVTDDFIYIKDARHKFLFASAAFARLTGHTNGQELVGKDDFDIFPAEHAAVYFEYEKAVIQEGKKLSNHEEPYYDHNGQLRWVTSTKNPVFDDAGNVIGLIGISKDITDLKNQKEQISHLATHDDLTGLFNRRAFYELGQRMLDQAIREEKTVALLYLDLDKFKVVNDAHGHIAGDFVLKSFAEHLQRAARSYDLIARIGGDEFVVAIAAEKPESIALALAQRIIDGFDTSKIFNCTCSIGIALSEPDETLEALLLAADEAMYDAKKSPQGSFQLYIRTSESCE